MGSSTKSLFRELLISLFKCQALRKQSNVLTKRLSSQLRSDRNSQLIQLGQKATQLPYIQFVKAMQAAGVHSRRRPTGLQPLPMIRNKEGELLLSAKEIANRWREHFSEQEDGIEVTAEELMDFCDERDRSAWVLPQWTDLPTLLQIERHLRVCKFDKAFFLDGVPGELCHLIPETMAQIVYPLYLKEAAYQREALLFKGGRLAPAHKKGDPSLCNNHRSLFVSSMLGKVLHSLYRQKLGPVLEELRLPMQIGGVKGHSIVQASHSLILFQAWCRQQKYSMAICRYCQCVLPSHPTPYCNSG